MSHTSGPWYSHLRLSVACENDGEYGDATCITNTPEEEYVATGNSGDWVAFVPHDRDHAANARLIAAAPDLLAACKEMAEILHSMSEGGAGMSEGAAAPYWEVIRKAEGRE
jgi:hypothetical protein